jgi:hypothetical protein
MYTFAPTSQARRSAQTVLWQITEALVRLVAPILSFTADEVWEYLPVVEGREASVHLAQFPKPDEILSADSAPLLRDWHELLDIRGFTLQLLEVARQDKLIGKALDSEVEILAKESTLDVLRRYEGQLKEYLGVSAVRITNGSNDWEFTNPSKSEGLLGRSQGVHPGPFQIATYRQPPATSARAAGTSCRKSPTTASGTMSARAASRRSRKWASTRPSRRPHSDLDPAPPSALAAAHLRSDIHRRPAHQELGGRARAHGRSHSRDPPRPAHHALDQRGRGLLALRQLGLAAHWSAGASSPSLLSPRWWCSSLMIRMGSRINMTTVALALIFAGALGNVHDRILYGSVVDFIEVHIFSYHWPDFNVADSSVVTGACLLFLESLLPHKNPTP